MTQRDIRGTSRLRRRGTFSIASALVLVGFAYIVRAQSPAPVKATAATPITYVSQSAVPSQAREFLTALGTRLQIPGTERSTVVGTAIDHYGQGTAQFIWQAPGNIRLDRSYGSAPPIIIESGVGLVNGDSVGLQDLNVLETLFDDAAETFLYGFTKGYPLRFLGARFRTDDGSTANYQGPFYDLYETLAPSQAWSGLRRQKHFYFDSKTKLLTKVQYFKEVGDGKVLVVTQFNNWITTNGQSYPGQIVRLENGTPVFSFTTASAVAGPIPVDNLFPPASTTSTGAPHE